MSPGAMTFPPAMQKGVNVIEDGLINDVGLENEQGLIAIGCERAVRDQQFIQHIKLAEIAQRIAGLDGRLQASAEAIKGRWTEDGNFGVA